MSSPLSATPSPIEILVVSDPHRVAERRSIQLHAARSGLGTLATSLGMNVIFFGKFSMAYCADAVSREKFTLSVEEVQKFPPMQAHSLTLAATNCIPVSGLFA